MKIEFNNPSLKKRFAVCTPPVGTIISNYQLRL
jgi:hypothetical protein